MGEYPTVIALTTRALYLGPGERADVIVDFSAVPAGSKLLLYNDAPAPAPGGDSRVDYYTGDRDQTAIGGAWATRAGYGPNTRTIMQFQVDGPAEERFDLSRLKKALPAAYAASQAPVLVPTAAYADAYGDALASAGSDGATATPDVLQVDDGALSFTPLGGAYRLTLPVQGKMVNDLFDPQYGRKTGALGVSAPLSANGVLTGVPYSALDPATEYLNLNEEAGAAALGDATQIWQITHEGTLSHCVTFEGFDVQVLRRARREGEARPADPGELGWKDTLRVDPLEAVIIAMRPVLPKVPFKVPASERALDITAPLGAEGAYTQLDALTAEPLQPEVVNALADLSFEAYWGIHLAGGEESHATRPVVLQGTAAAPEGLAATAAAAGVRLTWKAPLFPPPATGYEVRRTQDQPTGAVQVFTTSATETSFTDTTASGGTSFLYSVRTLSAAGWSPWSPPVEATTP